MGLAGTIVLAAALVAQTPAKPPAPATTVTGKWAITLEMQTGTASPALELVQEGEKVTGFYTGRYGKFPLTGTLKGRMLQFSFKMNAEGTDVVMAFQGEVAADFLTMKGTADLDGMGEAAWYAKRAEK